MGIIAHDFLDSNIVYIMRKTSVDHVKFRLWGETETIILLLATTECRASVIAQWMALWKRNKWCYIGGLKWHVKGSGTVGVNSGTALGRYFSNAFSATLRFRVQSTIYEHHFALSNLLGSLLEREQTLPKSEYFRCDRMWKTQVSIRFRARKCSQSPPLFLMYVRDAVHALKIEIGVSIVYDMGYDMIWNR